MDNIRSKAKKIYEWNQILCTKLGRSQKFYYFGVFFALLALFWFITPFVQIYSSVLLVAGGLLTCGVISDILIAYEKVWKTNIGKGLILVIYATATNLAYSLSSQLVNEIIKFESSSLIYTTNLVAVLLLPIFAFGFTYVVFGFIIIFGQVYMFVAAQAEDLKKSECLKDIVPENLESYPFLSFLVRFVVFFPAVLGLYWAFAGQVMPKYAGFVENTTKAFIYNFEAKRFSRCKTLKGQKVIKVSDKEIVVVENINGEYKFKPQLCIAKL